MFGAPMPPDSRLPRVLVIAYSAEPERGSEPAAGWGIVSALSEFAECTVLVGPEHTARLRHWRAEHPHENINFIEVPEPPRAMLAKRHRVTRFALYLHWLHRAQRVGQRLHRQNPFDLVYHATFSVYWLPSPISGFDTPAIWGPVGGAVTTPIRLWPLLGLRGILGEVLDMLSIRALARLPATRRSWTQASVRIVQNQETMDRLPSALQRNTLLLNHVMFSELPPLRNGSRRGGLLHVSSLEPRKGSQLAIRALAQTPRDVRLVVVGDGPDRAALERLTRRLGVSERVEFRGWLSRPEVFELLASCAAAVFTGLREEGGVALAEAMFFGAPVIVLANGGARTIAESATDPARVVLVEPGSVADTARRMGEAMTRMSRSPSSSTGPLLDQEAAKRTLKQAFERALVTSAGRSKGCAVFGVLPNSARGEP
jgi:glycosyltransferase involved in cell wall biosynthesis